MPENPSSFNHFLHDLHAAVDGESLLIEAALGNALLFAGMRPVVAGLVAHLRRGYAGAGGCGEQT